MRKLPPHAVEAEVALLGSMLVDPLCVPSIRNIIPTGEWFTRPRHSVIFDAMLAIVLESGGALDIVLLNQKLEDLGEIKQAGGLDYLVALANAFPSSLNATYYASLVRHKHLTQRALMAAGDLIYQLHDRPDELVLKLGEALSVLGEIQRQAAVFSPIVGHTDSAAQQNLNGRNSGAPKEKAGSRRA